MRLLAASLLLLLGSCDPSLNLSSARPTKIDIEGCPEAVAHLKECCPRYESYLSCVVYENDLGGRGTPDLSTRQSGCVRASDCGAIEKAITSGSELCGVAFKSRVCR